MIYKLIKRIFDLILSISTLIIFIPLFAVVILILKISDEGEVFFYQKRLGFNYKEFMMIKFATMKKNSWKIGSKSITTRNDPRVTKFGRVLRLTKINEFPQIINVIVGNMSIVGPRPLPESSFLKYNKQVREKLYINKPGITGLGSLVFRDEEKIISIVAKYNLDPMIFYKQHIYPFKGALELYYFHNKSFWVDFKIIFATALKIVLSSFKIENIFFKKLPVKPSILDPTNLKKKLDNGK
jgi:lipopolysaccharide/colanic/teichoic acid biosynthesis glycosyltransferase